MLNHFDNVERNFRYLSMKVDTAQKCPAKAKIWGEVLANFDSKDHKKITEAALNLARSTRAYVTSSVDDVMSRKSRLDRYWIEVHRKFTLSIACLILFFIGAPLGAIIRKGGLGLPTVFSIVFFLIYYLLSITGEKFAKEGVWPTWQGMWLSSFVLLPIGLFLTRKAITDSAIFEWDFYLKPLKNLAERIRNTTANHENTAGLP